MRSAIPRTALVLTLHPVDDARVRRRSVGALSKGGWRVELWGVDPVNDSAADDTDVVVRTIGPLQRDPLGRLAQVARLAHRALRSHAEVCHVHDPDLVPILLLLKVLRRRLVCVYDVHEFYADKWCLRFPVRVRPTARRCIDAIEKFMARSVDGVVVVSDAMEDRYRPHVRRSFVAPNHVLLGDFGCQSLCRVSGPVSLITTGTLARSKGSLVALAIAHEIDRRGLKWTLTIVERFFSEDERECFYGQLEQKGVPRCLNLIPNMPPDRLPFELERHDIGLSLLQPVGQYPYSVPSKLFEYMASGLAVVASDLPATRDVLSVGGLRAACSR